MARVKLSALASTIDGSLNGSALHTAAGSTFLRNKAYPKQANSIARQKRLNQFSTIAGTWSGLAAAEKRAWDDLAKRRTITDKNGALAKPTGYNYFLSINNLLSAFGRDLITSPEANESPGGSCEIKVEEFNILSTPDGFSVDSIILNFEALTYIPNNCIAFISISAPQFTSSKKLWKNMTPLVAVDFSKEVVKNASFQIAIPNPSLPELFPIFPGHIYRFELRLLDVNSKRLIPVSTTSEFSQTQILAPPITTNPRSRPIEVLGAEVSGQNLITYTFGLERDYPLSSLSDFIIEGYTYIPTESLKTLSYKSPVYLGSAFSSYVNVVDIFFGIGIPNMPIMAATLNNLPIDFSTNSPDARLPALIRFKHVPTNTFSQFYHLNRQISYI